MTNVTNGPKVYNTLAERVSERADLLARCYREMESRLPELPKEQLQALACTLYISLTRV